MREPTNGKGAHIECLMNGKGVRRTNFRCLMNGKEETES